MKFTTLIAPFLAGQATLAIAAAIGGVDTERSWLSSMVPSGVVYDVDVGLADQLSFLPNRVDGFVGDKVRFRFHSYNHSISQSSIEQPCTEKAYGFRTEFQLNPTNSDIFETLITITDLLPKYYFCHQVLPVNHCQTGMVFAINPGDTMTQFLQNVNSLTDDLASSTSWTASTSATILDSRTSTLSTAQQTDVTLTATESIGISTIGSNSPINSDPVVLTIASDAVNVASTLLPTALSLPTPSFTSTPLTSLSSTETPLTGSTLPIPTQLTSAFTDKPSLVIIPVSATLTDDGSLVAVPTFTTFTVDSRPSVEATQSTTQTELQALVTCCSPSTSSTTSASVATVNAIRANDSFLSVTTSPTTVIAATATPRVTTTTANGLGLLAPVADKTFSNGAGTFTPDHPLLWATWIGMISLPMMLA